MYHKISPNPVLHLGPNISLVVSTNSPLAAGILARFAASNGCNSRYFDFDKQKNGLFSAVLIEIYSTTLVMSDD